MAQRRPRLGRRNGHLRPGRVAAGPDPTHRLRHRAPRRARRCPARLGRPRRRRPRHRRHAAAQAGRPARRCRTGSDAAVVRHGTAPRRDRRRRVPGLLPDRAPRSIGRRGAPPHHGPDPVPRRARAVPGGRGQRRQHRAGLAGGARTRVAGPAAAGSGRPGPPGPAGQLAGRLCRRRGRLLLCGLHPVPRHPHPRADGVRPVPGGPVRRVRRQDGGDPAAHRAGADVQGARPRGPVVVGHEPARWRRRREPGGSGARGRQAGVQAAWPGRAARRGGDRSAAHRQRAGPRRAEGRLGPRVVRGLPRRPDDPAVHLDGLGLRAGGAEAGRPVRGRRLLLPLASAAFYWSGMVLNDWADRHRDAVERPERPIPAGEIPPAHALAAAAALTGGGVALAAAGGGRAALRVAVPLAGAIWAYDLLLKSTPAAPVGMAACRGLNVLLGAGSWRHRGAAVAAATVATHTAGVTVLSAGEVHGASVRAARAALAGTAAVTAAALTGPARSPRYRAAAAAFGTVYAATVARAQFAALRTPDPTTVRTATVAGVHGMIPLQAALAARSGAGLGAAAVAAALPLARRLARRVNPS